MMLVLSGEGPTDLGCCRAPVDHCTGDDFAAGPLAIIVDRLLEPALGYRPLLVHPTGVHFVSKARLTQRARDGARHRGFAFIGKRRKQETGYFYIAAWMCGQVALELETEHDDRGIAVLHRDSDDRSDQPSLWESKFKSMQDGFARAGHARGVPMLPRPISESWLLCAARPAVANCAALEDESASAKSLRPLKQQLDEAFGERRDAQAMAEWIDGAFHPAKLGTMPSFVRFRDALHGAVASVLAEVKALTGESGDE